MNRTILFLFSCSYFCNIVSSSLTFFQNNKTEVLLIYYKLLLKRKEYLDQEILNLQEKLSLLPPGKLVCTKNGKRFKWYHSLNHSYTYLPKSQEILAENLALKDYCQLQLKYLTAERDAINAYLFPHCPKNSPSGLLLLMKQILPIQSSFPAHLYLAVSCVLNQKLSLILPFAPTRFLSAMNVFSRLIPKLFSPTLRYAIRKTEAFSTGNISA